MHFHVNLVQNYWAVSQDGCGETQIYKGTINYDSRTWILVFHC